MQLTNNDPPVDSDVLDQASAWIARLASDHVAPSDIQAFALWLAQSDAHKCAYDQTLELWQELGVVRHLPIDIPPITPPETQITQRSSRRNWVGLSALAASIIVAVLTYPMWFNTTQTQFYSTGVGEQQTVYLDDGSSVTLNTNTRLEVHIDSAERSIKLHSGEAFFEVAKDPQRPFVVNSCFREMRALGTAFNVRCDRVSGLVTVTEGLVQVAQTSRNQVDTGAKLVRRGQSIPIADTPDLANVLNTQDQELLGWRQGQLIFKNTPLIDVISEANRYSTVQIKLGTAQLAQLQVTGRFELTDTKTLLAALKHSLSLVGTSQGDKTIILNRTEP